MLAEIEKAILIANLGFNPMNNGESIIINIPNYLKSVVKNWQNSPKLK